MSKDTDKLTKELEEKEDILHRLNVERGSSDSDDRQQKDNKEIHKETNRETKRETNRDIQVDAGSLANGFGRSIISIGLLGVLAGVAGRIWSAFMGNDPTFSGSGPISAMSWIFLALGLLLICAGAVKLIQQRRSPHGVEEPAEISKVQPLQDEKEERNRKLEWEKQRIRAEWKEKQVRLQNLQDELAELEMPDNMLKSLKKTDAALKLAEEKMLAAARNMVRGFGDILNQRASEILGRITDGQYTKLLIDEQLNMTLYKSGRRIAIGRVSCGTVEQVYFALRMAVVDILYEETLPIILDEAFSFYDEKRLKSALKWLSEQQRQVIIFTCQKRESEISRQFAPSRLKGRVT